ncbi:MAG: Structural maintenance of chromosomes protein 1 [Bogoriella megaspora]|nr:MAG: Structural maintenance of chromosomes protein 1 [Bogoriella megaspora]
MGKLIRLELFNFKSYKGHHVMLFGDSYFTSIIGPNGSGKSNSMDAISFVLGIKSSHLRSAQLRDLVYRGRVLKTSKINADGTATDQADGGVENGANGHTNGNGEAGSGDEVMQAGSQRNDPQTAWVMAVYEDDAGEEIRWRRSITSSGQSEYRINNRVVGAKQYNEALEEQNILIKARNFLVFQGDVEAIASQSPKDLTRLIEQISGSLEYKADYDRLKIEADKAAEEQNFMLNQRRGVNSEIKQYQEQKREADNYQKKVEEHDEAIVTHVLYKLFNFQRVMEESGAEIQRHQEELKEFRRSVEKYETNLAEAQRNQAKASKDVNQLQRNIRQKEKDADDKTNELLPVDEKIAVLKDKQKKSLTKIATFEKEKDEPMNNIKKLQKDLDGVQKAQQRYEQERAKLLRQEGYQLSPADLSEYENLTKQVARRTGDDQNAVNDLSRQLRTDGDTVNNLKRNLDIAQANLVTNDGEIEKLVNQQKDRQTQAKAATKDFEMRKKEMNKIKSENLKTEQMITEKNEKLYEVLRQIETMTQAQNMSMKERQDREMVAKLKRLFPGVRGRLFELCRPKQKKYELAVTLALGRENDSIVVDTHKAAEDCLHYLKTHHIGKARMLPLDTVQYKAPNPNLKGLHKGMRLAVDVIDYDHAYERAVYSACSNTMVCDDLDIAKYLCYQKKIEAKAVTLDGNVIAKGGSMTGGRGKDDHVRVSSRTYDDTEIQNLRDLAEKYQSELSTLGAQRRSSKSQAELENLSSEAAGLESNLQYLSKEIKGLDYNLESERAKRNRNSNAVADIQPKYSEQAAGLEGLRIALKKHQEAIAAVQDQVFAQFCSRLGFPNIRTYMEQQGTARQEASTELANFRQQISRLNQGIQFAQSVISEKDGRINKLKYDADNSKQAIGVLEQERGEIVGSMDVLNAEMEQFREEMARLNEVLEQRQQKVQEARRELQKRSKNIEAVNKDIATLDAEMARNAAGRYALLKRSKIDGTRIPLKEGSSGLEILPLEDLGDEDTMDLDDEDNPSQMVPTIKDYGIDVDFDDLDDDYKEEMSERDAQKKEAQLQDDISSLASQLEKLNPNMRAIDRLNSTETRLKTIERDFDASRRAAKRAKDDFDDVKAQRYELFHKAFSHISEQIGSVYRDLTKSANFPAGGQAYLDIEDSDEPYLSGVRYHAMPPLKRFRDMEHLSGGEKSIAALALLFAVHSHQPSPFFVLDEVDAALDNANVAKVAGYVKQHARPGMQFIVISLKMGMFVNSETLVGIMRDQGANSSRALTLDLRKYQEG